jgi:hypothetical protein
MNDQIAKTLNQPAFDRLKDWYDIGPVQKATLELFAELIVRECSRYIEDKFDFCGDEIIIAESVLKHFGVEE